MKRLKNMSFKHIITIFFCAFVFVCGVLTLTVNFKEVFGGLVRGYIKMPKDSNVSEKLSNSLSTFDTRMNEYFIFHDLAIDSYGGIQKVMDKHLIDDPNPHYNVMKLKNDYLTFANLEYNDNSYSDDTNWELINYLKKIKKTCENKNSDILYVKKFGKGIEMELLPDYYPYRYFSGQSQTEKELGAAGIGVLDLNNMIIEEGIDKYSLLYKTDHHWTIKAGLWASNHIANELNERYQAGIDTQKLDLKNYTVETHNKSFLGTQGVRTGTLYTEKDDFDFIYPNYPTNIEYSVRNKNINLSGSFFNTILHNKTYKEGYHAYMPATYDLTTIINHKSNNGKYAVFVVDSFGSAVAPFLSQTFKRMDCIDLRYFSDDFNAYIDNNKPDVVIYMVDYTDNALLDFVE